MGIYKIGVVIVASFLLFGCATRIPVNKQVGQINFDYEVGQQAKNNNKVIAIVSPAVVENTTGAGFQNNQRQALNPFYGQRINTTSVDFNGDFRNHYEDRLKTALESTFYEIFAKKGFKTQGPYATFDDITYSDKKAIYLASVPQLTLNIDKKPTKNECRRLYCNEEGQIQVTGEFTLKLIEPLTQQTFLTKRINLSDFRISKAYVKESQYRYNSGGIVETALDKSTAPKQLVDNTDKVLVEALNEFYSKASSKIDRYLSADELLSYAGDVKVIKKLKRF